MSLASLLTLSIVSHGHGPLLQRLLDDLEALPSLQGTTTMVTLNLGDESLDIARFTRLHIETIRNGIPQGFGANHNQAFRRCTTPWFAVLNPDLRIAGDVFTPLIGTAAATEAALLAPRVMTSEGGVEDSVRSNLTPWSLAKRALGIGERYAEPDDTDFRWYAGMFYLIRSSAYASAGGFDERFFLYCEDYDLCARLHLLGFLSYCDEKVEVVHDAQRDSHRSARHLRMHLASLMRVWTSAPVWRIALQDMCGQARST